MKEKQLHHTAISITANPKENQRLLQDVGLFGYVLLQFFATFCTKDGRYFSFGKKNLI